MTKNEPFSYIFFLLLGKTCLLLGMSMYLFHKRLKRAPYGSPFNLKIIYSYKIFYLNILYGMVKKYTIYENVNMQMKDRLKNIGIRIKSERLRRGLSQEELAEKCEISRNAISLIETGKMNPTIIRVLDIAQVLGVDINSLVKEA